jgi:hypothetical protein
MTHRDRYGDGRHKDGDDRQIPDRKAGFGQQAGPVQSTRLRTEFGAEL